MEENMDGEFELDWDVGLGGIDWDVWLGGHLLSGMLE